MPLIPNADHANVSALGPSQRPVNKSIEVQKGICHKNEETRTVTNTDSSTNFNKFLEHGTWIGTGRQKKEVQEATTLKGGEKD